MSRVKANAVKGLQNAVDKVNIYANEGDIYTVGLQVGSDELTVCNSEDKPLLFRSLAMAKAAFKQCKRAKTEIICAHAYDEMIGQNDDVDKPRYPR